MLNQWDAIVAGAGQAGCAAAWDLASGGARVLLLHSGPERSKPCAGGVTTKALQRYRFALDEVIRESSNRFRLDYGAATSATLTTQAPFCVMTHRAELDALVRRRACEQGAVWQRTAGVRELHQSNSGVSLVTLEGQRHQGACLIAADGAHSPIRRLLQGQGGGQGALALEGHLPREQACDYPAMTLDFGVLPGGYGWLFPKGDHINVGLYVWRRDRFRPTLAALSAYTRQALGSDRLEAVSGHPIGTWLGHRPSLCGRVVFVGDAAATTESLLGEGIYGALLSAQMAAAAVLAGRLTDYPLLLAAWRDEVKQVATLARLFYRVRGPAYWVLRRWLAPGLLQGYAEGLTLGGIKRAWFSGRRFPDSSLG